MQRTRIDWADFSANPVKGLCPVDCKDIRGKSYCYARRMYLNPYYKAMYRNQTIRFEPREILKCAALRESTRIFVGSTIELFGPWVKPEWLKEIMAYCKGMNWLTFIFLTKQPQNLPREFPPNCWVGVSATNSCGVVNAIDYLDEIDASVKFLSLEPLLDWSSNLIHFTGKVINWLIIGAQTPYSSKTAPRVEWVKEIVEAADKAGVPVFLKDNLNPIFAANDCALYRQYRDAFSDSRILRKTGQQFGIYARNSLTPRRKALDRQDEP